MLCIHILHKFAGKYMVLYGNLSLTTYLEPIAIVLVKFTLHRFACKYSGVLQNSDLEKIFEN
jgi:hypothetical protein